MANKKVTIEDLARMVKRGFDGVDKRFDRVDKKLERMEKRLEGIVYRTEFEKLEFRVKELEDLLAVGSGKR
ncbi:MAG: hypothetical protein G01um101430_411 [Parcubacteria group bacterium Gr01-1014_30]|nr:MAG: hypothetical protein G01um101430_411 [Parcubacteria group bacterium Gr01-1014_30]